VGVERLGSSIVHSILAVPERKRPAFTGLSDRQSFPAPPWDCGTHGAHPATDGGDEQMFGAE
jgi:hypothetical protein